MHYKESGGIDLQQQKEEKMAESSYNSKGEQMAWDDREIIAQFLCRDEAAIKNTVDKYERYCSSIAYRILGNGEDVRECLNDTWMKLWESIPPTVPEILSAYVGKITRNLAINRYDHLHAGKRCGDSVDQPLEELKECASLAHDNVRENGPEGSGGSNQPVSGRTSVKKTTDLCPKVFLSG